MRLISFFRIIPLLAFLVALPTAQGLKIAGSDLLPPEISDAILEALDAANVSAEMDLVGSVRALEAMAADQADVCIVAVPDKADQPAFERQFGFAFQIVAFGVNQRNPLEELDYAQLSDIFETGGATNTWNNLVSAGRLQDRKINLWAARSNTVIALEIFNDAVLDGSSLKDSIRYDAQSAEQLMQVVRNDDAAMILIPNMPTSSEVRILAIKAGSGEQSYTPTPDNVFYGDYPLRLPFQVIVDADLEADTMTAVLRAIYSDGVTRALERAYYMPLPELERQAVLNQFK